jgi:hypothetical protein
MNENQSTGPQASTGLNLSPFCIHLRSKKLFFGSAPPMTEEDVLDGSNHCWCRHTMQILGPDKGRAAPSRCRAGRSCFESILESEIVL